ncbi:MAG: RpoL/Rpb11 RNA polymerase subunit family protein [Candidatus Woesearchaeota archaeon]
MEVKILEETKKKAVIEIDNQTIATLIERELWNDPHVKTAGQKLKHPLIGKPTLVIETDDKEDPKTAVKESIKRLKKEIEKFSKSFQTK